MVMEVALDTWCIDFFALKKIKGMSESKAGTGTEILVMEGVAIGNQHMEPAKNWYKKCQSFKGIEILRLETRCETDARQ